MKKDRSHIRELDERLEKAYVSKDWKATAELAREILAQEPDHLKANSMKAFALWFIEKDADEGDRPAIKAERLDTARKVIELTDKEVFGPGFGVFIPENQNIIMSRKSAFNHLAWDMVEVGETPEDLEKGLEYIEGAIATPDFKVENQYLDTRARLLLKLGREDEAYTTVMDILSKDPHFKDIKDIAGSDGYRKWSEASKIEYTEEEAREVLGKGGSGMEAILSRITRPSEAGDQVPRMPGIIGKGISPELGRYCELLGANTLMDRLGYADHQLPDAPSFTYMLETQDGNWLGRLRSFFCGTTIIATESEATFSATWFGNGHGDSEVWYTHQDEWGIFFVASSITAHLYMKLQADEGVLQRKRFMGKEAFRRDAAVNVIGGIRSDWKGLDPGTLSGRVDWIVVLFTGIGDRKEALGLVPTLKFWDQEKPLMATRPNMAAYWLLHHAVFDNLEELREALDLCEGQTHPAVVEIRNYLYGAMHGAAVKPLVPWVDDTRLVAFREDAEEFADRGVFGPGALERSERLAASRPRPSEEAVKLWRELEAEAADGNESTAAALKALEVLEKVYSMDQHEFHQVSGGMDLNSFLNNFTDLVRGDPRWRPMLEHKLALAAGYEEGHRKAVPGLVQTLGALSKGYKDFMAILDRVGTRNFGVGRKVELAKVASWSYDEPEARQYLLKEASEWVDQINEWQRTVPDMAFALLMERQDPGLAPLVARLLETTDCTGKNWRISIAVAQYAGKAKVKEAVPGLRRVVRKELGRLDNGDRGRVIQALVDVGDEGARELLTGMYDSIQARWEKEERDDEWLYPYYHDPVCPILRGLLQLPPVDKAHIDKAHEIVTTFTRLKKLDKASWYSAAALMWGIRDGGHGGFRQEVRALGDRILAQDLGEIGGPFRKFMDETVDMLGP